MQLDIGPQVVLFKSPAREFIARALLAVLIAEILQGAFAGLVADGAIQRVIDQQEFHDPVAGVDHLVAGNILHHHPIHHIGTATRHQLWHRARVGGRAGRYFHQTGATFSAAAFQLAVVTHGRRSPRRRQSSGPHSKMLVPGSTSMVILSIVTLNNFFSSAITLLFHTVNFPLMPAPLPPKDPHNAPTHNSSPNTPAGYPHATRIRP